MKTLELYGGDSDICKRNLDELIAKGIKEYWDTDEEAEDDRNTDTD